MNPTKEPTITQKLLADATIRDAGYGELLRRVAALIAERDAAMVKLDLWRARLGQISGCSDARTAREIASGALAALPGPAPANEPELERHMPFVFGGRIITQKVTASPGTGRGNAL